jgi:hypothetical protein
MREGIGRHEILPILTTLRSSIERDVQELHPHFEDMAVARIAFAIIDAML